MLWVFRKEIIFLFLLLISISIQKKQFKNISFNEKVENKKIVNYEEILEENKRLREILQLKEKKIIKRFIIAEIISLKPPVFPAEIIIDKGERNGIRKNMNVITKDLFLIGKVEEVEENYSKVSTVFNNKVRISVILNPTNEIGILEGGYVPFLLLKYIPYDSKVKIGDYVITSSLSEYYFSGLKIGKVIKISNEVNSLYLKIWVKPEILSHNFKEVIVVY